jgi:hypothetical protein
MTEIFCFTKILQLPNEEMCFKGSNIDFFRGALMTKRLQEIKHSRLFCQSISDERKTFKGSNNPAYSASATVTKEI